MSGLDSIALAVAHLEEKREVPSQHETPRHGGLKIEPKLAPSRVADTVDATATPVGTVQSSYSSVVIDSHPSISAPPPPPRALHSPPARAVSVDDTVTLRSSSKAESTCSPPSTPTPSQSSSMFGFILADPITWLAKTQNRPPLQPPPPDTIIDTVQASDVLCGRGGETNHHVGNIQYRLLVKAFQPLYVSAKRREKPLIAQCIVYSVRRIGGRFLKRTSEKEWKDVGNTKAREKTSQALREGAPELRGETAVAGRMNQSNQTNIATTHHKPMSGTDPAPAPNGPSTSVVATPAAQQPANILHFGGAQVAIGSMEATLLSAFLPSLQQALRRSVTSTPPTEKPRTPSALLHPSIPSKSNKRQAAIISDSHSDSESSSTHSATSTSNLKGGPRLKRFKERFQQENST